MGLKRHLAVAPGINLLGVATEIYLPRRNHGGGGILVTLTGILPLEMPQGELRLVPFTAVRVGSGALISFGLPGSSLRLMGIWGLSDRESKKTNGKTVSLGTASVLSLGVGESGDGPFVASFSWSGGSTG